MLTPMAITMRTSNHKNETAHHVGDDDDDDDGDYGYDDDVAIIDDADAMTCVMMLVLMRLATNIIELMMWF